MGETIREHWTCEVNNFCQAAIGKLEHSDPFAVQPFLQRLLDGLPLPKGPGETTYLRLSFAVFVSRLGEAVHQQYHVVYQQKPCGSAPPPGWQAWTDPQHSLEQLTLDWGAGFNRWFEGQHTIPPVLRARRLLEEQFADPPTTSELARTVGCSRTTLHEQFTTTFGWPPAEYTRRLQLTKALRRLATSNDSVAVVAQDVGYSSSNKFYAAVRRYTGLSPAQVRQ